MSGDVPRETETPASDGPHRADIGLAWGLKSSFLAYLERIGDAVIRLIGGAAVTSTGEFYFPFESADDARAAFTGQIVIVAHAGMLQLALCDPLVEWDAHGGGVLWLRPAPERDRVPVLDLAPSNALPDRFVVMRSEIPAVLRKEATSLFGDVYPAREPMEPVTVRLPLATPQSGRHGVDHP